MALNWKKFHGVFRNEKNRNSMRFIFTLFLLLGIALIACDKSQNNCSSVPACVQELINTNKASFCSNSKIDEYTFQSKTVYVFKIMDCIADGASCVFDLNCKELGCLGGIAGNSKINGIDFNSNAKFVGTVWSNWCIKRTQT